MTNREIYRKTLVFSVRRLLFDILAFLLLGAITMGGFLLMDRINDKGMIGLGIGLIVGIVAVSIILRYISYTYKAGQIAMMTKGVTENELPENVLAEGKQVVRSRFATVALFFAATRIIKSIFNQLSRALNSVGKSVGGNTGDAVTSAIGIVISVLVAYLSDCCLGWVFYRKEQKSAKATCEGAVLFFRHGKTLLKNMGRVFGMGLLSLLLIGGAFFGIFYAFFSLMPKNFELLTAEIQETAVRLEANLPELMSDPAFVMIIAAAIAAVILWSILHSVFVRPFVLVGVLRNYMESGMNDIPTEASFASLDSKSPRFRKLHTQGA